MFSVVFLNYLSVLSGTCEDEDAMFPLKKKGNAGALLLTRFRPSAKLRNAAKPGAQRDPLRALRRGRKK